MILDFKGKGREQLKGEVIMSEPRLKRLARKMRKIDEFAFDTETTSLRVQWKGEVDIVGISICFGKHDTYYIPTGHFFDEGQLDLDLVLKYLRPVFQRKDVRIIGHNLKYDMHVLACFDVNIQTKDLFDTMVASFTIDENEQKGLKHLTNLVYDVPQEKYDDCLGTVTKEEKKAFGLKGSKKPPFQLVRIPIGAPYAMADAYWTWRHYTDWMLDQLSAEEVEKIYFNVMIPFLKTLFNMERRGVRVNKARLMEMQAKAEIDLAELEYKIVEMAGIQFNIASSQQLGELLFGYKKFDKNGNYSGNKNLVDNTFGFPVMGTTDSGAPSTGESALLALAKLNYKKDKRKLLGLKMVKLILKYKKLNKLKSAFIDGLLEQIYSDGKVHPTFNLGGASSGRLSCSEPNLQQLPRPVEEPDKPKREKFETEIKYQQAMTKYEKDYEEYEFWKFYEIRDVFTSDNPKTESLIALDFSNLEMRLLAHFSKDPNLIDTFVHDHDAHGATAVNMFQLDCSPDEAKKKFKGLRQIAKTINFMLMYGGGASTLYNTLAEEDALDENGDPISKEKSQEYYDKYFEAYEGVSGFIKNQKKYAHRYEMIYTLIGRKRRLPDINGKDFKTISYLERLSVNGCIQGSGADIMMMCQPKIEFCEKLAKLGCTMRLQVHDELVFNCPDKNIDKAIAIIKEYMEHPLPKPLNVPLRADSDSGKTYAEAK